MSKFTPGPWTAGSKSVYADETEDRLAMRAVLTEGSRDDMKANARLMAESPALFEALQEALFLIEREVADGAHTTEATRARAVLSRVLGRPA